MKSRESHMKASQKHASARLSYNSFFCSFNSLKGQCQDVNYVKFYAKDFHGFTSSLWANPQIGAIPLKCLILHFKFWCDHACVWLTAVLEGVLKHNLIKLVLVTVAYRPRMDSIFIISAVEEQGPSSISTNWSWHSCFMCFGCLLTLKTDVSSALFPLWMFVVGDCW